MIHSHFYLSECKSIVSFPVLSKNCVAVSRRWMLYYTPFKKVSSAGMCFLLIFFIFLYKKRIFFDFWKSGVCVCRFGKKVIKQGVSLIDVQTERAFSLVSGTCRDRPGVLNTMLLSSGRSGFLFRIEVGKLLNLAARAKQNINLYFSLQHVLGQA